MPMKQKTFLSILISSIISAAALWSLTGCLLPINITTKTHRYHQERYRLYAQGY